jgi:hypothetical protein
VLNNERVFSLVTHPSLDQELRVWGAARKDPAIWALSRAIHQAGCGRDLSTADKVKACFAAAPNYPARIGHQA